MYFGADYYPEHWPEQRWGKDIKMMKEANFNVVRLAEFTWTKMEPKEGVYNFEIEFVDCGNKSMNSSTSYMQQIYIDPTVATGIKQVNTTSSELNIYPNPVRDIFIIEGENITNVEIININGKVVRIINNIDSKKSINVSTLNQGIYFVKVGNEVSKLVKL